MKTRVLTTMMVMMAACAPRRFAGVGSWRVLEGRARVACEGAPVADRPLGGVFVVSERAAGGLDVATPDGCKTRYRWADDTAVLRGAQTCTLDAPGVTGTQVTSAARFTVDGGAATFTSSGNGTFNGTACTFDVLGRLVGVDDGAPR